MDSNINNGSKYRNTQNSKMEHQILSASDIERYGYCPLSWWINIKGPCVTNEKLEKGTYEHKELIKKVSTVKEKERVSKASEFNIKLFAFIAIILAVNAIAIILPLTFVKNFLIFIAALWIIIALIYVSYYLIQEKYSKSKHFFKGIHTGIGPKKRAHNSKSASKAQQSVFSTSPQTWKRSAVWFLIIAGGLAFNGIAFLQPASPKIMSRIFMVSALLWLIGTMVILFFVLRYEEEQKKRTSQHPDLSIKKLKYKLIQSENLIIAFAVVATLLAVNGLTVQHREGFAEFTAIGQIIMFLAALWLGISFAFLYISFRSRILTSRLARDIKQAPTESKKYKIVVEKTKSLSIPNQIFSYNWSLFFTVVAVILGINSILIRYGSEIMYEHSDLFSRFLVIIALLWLIGAFIFLYDVLRNTQLAREIRRLSGIYQGKIEYADKMDDKTKILFSRKYRIRGKPDYIVKIKGKYIPVEIKTGKVPKGPHFSHIIQLAAYCLLINENYHIRPPYGIISYSKEKKHKIDYDSKLENLLIEKIAEMRNCMNINEVHRNHNRVGKCLHCSRRSECLERLD